MLIYERVLIPAGGSADVQVAIDHGIKLARRFDAEIHALSVVETEQSTTLLDNSEFEQTLERIHQTSVAGVEEIEQQAGSLPVHTSVKEGMAPACILEYAESATVDVIVMATNGRTGTEREIIGSVTESVIRKASVPVVVVNTGSDLSCEKNNRPVQ